MNTPIAGEFFCPHRLLRQSTLGLRYPVAYLMIILWHTECTVLLNTLEQSARSPELAAVLAKSLLRILQHSIEKIVSSFKALIALPRTLKVTCIQIHESKRHGMASSFAETATSVGILSKP